MSVAIRKLIRNKKRKRDGEEAMLEQNTDRSYFMIGAVIIAAILIAGATYIFRDVLFTADTGLIPKLINGIFGKAEGLINGISTEDGLN